MFAIPGFNVGSLVVEAPKEQIKKRKHDTPTESSGVSTETASTTASTATTGAASNTATSPSSTLQLAPSTSNAPFSKKFKKEPVYERRPPSEPQPGWGWIPEPVPLKERASWNRSTKELRKAKAEEERVKKAKIVSSISSPASAVDLLLQGSVDLKDIAGLGKKNADKKRKGKDQEGDVEMRDSKGTNKKLQQEDGEETPKKRNKRLERKIKRAAYIAALESKTPDQDVTAAAVELEAKTAETPEVSVDVEAPAEGKGKEEGSNDGKKKKEKKQQAPAPVHPEIAKLTNKEKRLLRQFQKKQQLEGVDLAAQALPELLNPVVKKVGAEPVAEAVNKKEGKKDKNDKKDKKDGREENETSKKQQQLAKEREELLVALNRTNNALAELQNSLGDGGDDEAPMSKADVKSAVQGKKSKKEKAKEKEATTPVAKKESAASATSTVAQQKQPKLTKLQEQMKKTLAGGKFRFLNEQLYTTTGEEAFGLFQSKPELFDEYHEGFRSQVELWPQNPVDIFIAQLRKMPKDTVIADLGCGDAQIAKELTEHQVLSFDLVAKNERVTACDIAHLPLEDGSVDVAIFCLSLMGTDFLKFLKEAYRVLKPNGQLKISEVISRFTDVDAFVSALKALGFELRGSDSSNKMFIMFDFVKPDPNQTSNSKKGKKGSKKQKTQEETLEVDIDSLDGSSLLKPCIYKKR